MWKNAIITRLEFQMSFSRFIHNRIVSQIPEEPFDPAGTPVTDAKMQRYENIWSNYRMNVVSW